MGIKTGRQTLSRQDKVRETERLKEKFERERRPETANYGVLAHLASTLRQRQRQDKWRQRQDKMGQRQRLKTKKTILKFNCLELID